MANYNKAGEFLPEQSKLMFAPNKTGTSVATDHNLLNRSPTGDRRGEAKADSPKAIILGDRSILVNVICMCLVWLSSSFCYYMISYQLKYLEGSIWVNSMVSSSSEIVAYATSGFLFNYIGFQNTLFISYVISIAGMACLTAYPDANQGLLSLFILGSKYGVSQIFNLAYVGNQYLF